MSRSGTEARLGTWTHSGNSTCLGNIILSWTKLVITHVSSPDRPQYKTDLSKDDSFCFLLLKHSFLFAVGVEKDVWIWQQSWRAGRPHYACQHRIKGHYSRVLCCDADSQGRIMTGSHDAQVRLWNLGPDLKGKAPSFQSPE